MGMLQLCDILIFLLKKEINMTLKDLIEICKTCDHRNKYDNMYFMAWWSFCQKECKLMKEWENAGRK